MNPIYQKQNAELARMLARESATSKFMDGTQPPLTYLKHLLGGVLYTFHRADGFYPLMLKDDLAARQNAESNPGTVKVVNEVTGETVWQE